MKIFTAQSRTNNFFVETSCLCNYRAGKLKVEKVLLKTKDNVHPSLILLKTNMNTGQVFKFKTENRMQYACVFIHKTDHHGVYEVINSEIYFEPLQSVFHVDATTYPDTTFEEILIFFSFQIR
ncbi:hypothetical protein LCDVSa022L [Lymphocystis disease virus 3]|uniref:Uncharacterized protein n=1 Tax=Lymphocystis disease virus 3 TaxID=2560566 RepID=A0A1B2RVT5_9VIRU|nr:hypothetical protein BZK12_gp022 [Lymphocystis disease virus Sa]AOC55106.1 hypothetical protein LCDVSa022L [Lymphocystis disease virus 3]